MKRDWKSWTKAAGVVSVLTSVAGLPEVRCIDEGGCTEPEDLPENDK